VATFLAYDPDLKDFATIDPVKAAAMIEDAEAMAVLAAPCLDSDTLTPRQLSAVRAILRGAVLRWNETGSGAMQTQAAGPFSATVDTRQERRGMFWPSEISQLRSVCGSSSSGAFTVDTVGTLLGGHAAICSLNFGALYCSCGAVLTNDLYPLYEV
jgi:hypothetical protein